MCSKFYLFNHLICYAQSEVCLWKKSTQEYWVYKSIWEWMTDHCTASCNFYTVQPAALFTLSYHDFIELTNWVHDCMINISRSYVLIYYNYSRFFILLNSPNVMNTISNFFASLVSSSARDITFVLNTNVSSRKTYYMNRQTIAIVPSSLIYVYLCHCP